MLLAMRAVKRRPCPETMVWAGLMGLESGDLELARQMLDQVRQLGGDPFGETEWLAMQIAYRDPEQRVPDLARELEGRRDLSPVVSQKVQLELMWAALREGDGNEARRRAEYLLKVDDVPDAHMGLWALATMDGNERAAKAQYERARLPKARKMYMEAYCRTLMRDFEGAGRLQAQLQELDPSLAESTKRWLKEEG